MISTYWQHVHPGACVEIKAGTWHVIEREGNSFTVRNPVTGQVVGPTLLSPGRPVTVLQPGDALYVPTVRDVAADAVVAPLVPAAAGALAVATAQVHLGAQVIAVEDGSGMTCPTADRWHVYLFHALDTELPPATAAAEVAALHAVLPATRPHRHV